MDDSAYPTADSLPLLTMNKAGKVPPARITKASALRSGYQLCYDQDDLNRRNRALQQALLDGEPPYDEAQLREANMPDTTNLNFGGAEQQLERAIAPYYTLVQSTENLVSIRTRFGPEEERADLEEIMAEEITRTIREWDQFPYQTIHLAKKFVWEYLGLLHWQDTRDWRYRSSGLGQFYFPSGSPICEDEVEIAYRYEEFTVTRLYNFIKNEELATKHGWNVPAVKKAIQKATASDPLYNDWERFQEEVKNNEFTVANRISTVKIIHGFAKEFDGRGSHYMTTQTDQGEGDEFLFQSRCCYKSMREAYVMFPYGYGTNGTVQGGRGLGYKIYAFEQQRNRSLGRLIDQGMLASSIMLQPQDDNSMAATALQYYGNAAVINPDVKVVNAPMPDLQRSVVPALQEMERLRNDRVSGYSSDNVFDGDQRKTKFEVAAKLQQSAQLSDSALDFWYGPFERAMQQVIRRMTRRTYVPEDPGGKEIQALKLRLVKRGVPLEAFYQIDPLACKVVKVIGAGSASAKTLSLAKLNDLRPRMDDVGQANLDWDLAVDAAGSTNAARYFRKDGLKRTTEQTNIAILENALLVQGSQIPVLPSDKHLAHAREHVKPLLEMFEMVEAGQLPIEEAAVQYRLLFIHNAEHVDIASGDPSSQEESAMFRQTMQQIGEVISNGLKKAQAAEAKAAEEAAMGGGEQQEQQIDPKMIQELERHRMKMQQAQELFELKKAQTVEMAVTKRAIADADGAAKIARQAGPRAARESQQP